MTPRAASLDKAFTLLTAIAARPGAPLAELAARAGLPLSTAYRLIASLESLGLVLREKKGRYLVGPAILDLARGADLKQMMARASRPGLRKLARRFRRTAHMAVFEDDMVTYVTKESGHPDRILTIEGSQLEAYCTGLGKVLLAHLPEPERERYLAEGPFIPLTATTITDPTDLRDELRRIGRRGYAIDNGESSDDLTCVAVPVADGAGRVFAALSISGQAADFTPAAMEEARHALAACARDIGHRLYPAGRVLAAAGNLA